MNRFFFPAVLLIALLLTVASPTMAEDTDRKSGKELFTYWCKSCHGPGPGHPGTQALEALYEGKTPAALEERTDLTKEMTRHFVRKGVSVMPFFRKTEISDAELEALAAYLARNNK